MQYRTELCCSVVTGTCHTTEQMAAGRLGSAYHRRSKQPRMASQHSTRIARLETSQYVFCSLGLALNLTVQSTTTPIGTLLSISYTHHTIQLPPIPLPRTQAPGLAPKPSPSGPRPLSNAPNGSAVRSAYPARSPIRLTPIPFLPRTEMRRSGFTDSAGSESAHGTMTNSAMRVCSVIVRLTGTIAVGVSVSSCLPRATLTRRTSTGRSKRTCASCAASMRSIRPLSANYGLAPEGAA